MERLPPEIHGATVTVGPVRAVVDAPVTVLRGENPDFELSASRTQAACRLPGGGRFWIEDGERVVVDACSSDRPGPWLHATVAAIVLAQQGRFALHANVVDVDGAVMAISGQRRAGKSTTSLALMKRGHRLITDDVAALDIESQEVVHRSDGRPVHIHPATAGLLGVSLEGATAVPGDPEKLALANPLSPPVAVDAIVLLRTAPRDDVHLVQLSTEQGTQAVHFHAYRRPMLDPIWAAEAFQWAAGVASRVPVWLMVRPADRWTVDDVCATLEHLSCDVRR